MQTVALYSHLPMQPHTRTTCSYVEDFSIQSATPQPSFLTHLPLASETITVHSVSVWIHGHSLKLFSLLIWEECLSIFSYLVAQSMVLYLPMQVNLILFSNWTSFLFKCLSDQAVLSCFSPFWLLRWDRKNLGLAILSLPSPQCWGAWIFLFYFFLMTFTTSVLKLWNNWHFTGIELNLL